MAEKINIPQKVVDAFSALIEIYGNCIEYIGEKKNKSYFWFNFPEDIDYGFPQVVCLKNGKVLNVEGFDAIKVLDLFNTKD